MCNTYIYMYSVWTEENRELAYTAYASENVAC